MCICIGYNPQIKFYLFSQIEFSHFLYPATLKSAGYYVIPSIQKIAFECPSIGPSAAHRFHSLLGAFFSPIFFKLAMRVDIGKECPGIADG